MISVSDFELEEILNIIQAHASDCDVLAFGSRYRWTAKDHSDLDLAFVRLDGEKLSLKQSGHWKRRFQNQTCRIKSM